MPTGNVARRLIERRMIEARLTRERLIRERIAREASERALQERRKIASEREALAKRNEQVKFTRELYNHRAGQVVSSQVFGRVWESHSAGVKPKLTKHNENVILPKYTQDNMRFLSRKFEEYKRKRMFKEAEEVKKIISLHNAYSYFVKNSQRKKALEILKRIEFLSDKLR